MSAAIANLQAGGTSVVFGGDFNRSKLPQPFAAGQKMITVSGIDKIGLELERQRRTTIEVDRGAALVRCSGTAVTTGPNAGCDRRRR